MDQPKKRQYRSIKRDNQARETRTQIIQAARKQFIQSGFAGATIEAIAREARVAVETVFAVFGSKRNILADVIQYSVGGDDQPVSVPERPGPQKISQEPDPVLRIQMFAKDVTDRLERTAPVYDVMRSAAKTEPEIKALLKQMQEVRYTNIHSLVRSFVDRDELREDLDETTGTETAWGLASPELYTLFAHDYGWSKEQWVQWLSNTLIRLLLP